MKRASNASHSESKNSSPNKKSKKTADGQSDLTSFFASPQGKNDAPVDFQGPAKKRDHQVISLLSDDDEEVTASRNEHLSASTSKTPVKKGEPGVDHKPLADLSPARLLGANTSVTTPLDQIDYSIDRDLFDFDPVQHVDTSAWPKSQGGNILVPYAFLANAFQKISATKSRLEITNLLANTLRTVICYQPIALLPTVYLVSRSCDSLNSTLLTDKSLLYSSCCDRSQITLRQLMRALNWVSGVKSSVHPSRACLA